MCVIEIVVKLHAEFLLAAENNLLLQPRGGLKHGELNGQIQ